MVFLAMGVCVHAGPIDEQKASDRLEQIDQSMERLRSLTLSLLRQMKGLENQYGGAPPPASSSPVSVYDQLGAIELLRESFDRNHLQLSRSAAELKRDLDQSEGEWTDPARRGVSRILEDLDKYRRVVEKALLPMGVFP
jgi:hypothetical protein